MDLIDKVRTILDGKVFRDYSEKETKELTAVFYPRSAVKSERIRFFRSPCCNSDFILARTRQGEFRICCVECMCSYGSINLEKDIEDLWS